MDFKSDFKSIPEPTPYQLHLNIDTGHLSKRYKSGHEEELTPEGTPLLKAFKLAQRHLEASQKTEAAVRFYLVNWTGRDLNMKEITYQVIDQFLKDKVGSLKEDFKATPGIKV